MALTRITTAVIEDDAITTVKMSNLVIDTAQLAAGAVTADKMAANAATDGPMSGSINKVQDNVTALTSNVDIVQDNVAAITDTTTDLTIQSAGSGYFFDKSITSLGINNTVPIAGTVSLGVPANVIMKYSPLGGNVIIAGIDDTSPYRLDVRGTANVGIFTATSVTTATVGGTPSFSGETTFVDDVIINGNLQVHGTTTTINSESLVIQDHFIKLANGVPIASSPTLDSGIFFNRGNQGNAALFYDESLKAFKVAETKDPVSNTLISATRTANLYMGNGHIQTLHFDGTEITSTGTELNYTDGVTSAIQTQLNTGTTNTGTTYNQLNANLNVLSDNVESLQTNTTANINIVQDNVAALSGSLQLLPFENVVTIASTANTFFVGKPYYTVSNVLIVTLDGINQSANLSDGTIQDFIVNATSTDASIVFTAPTIPIGTTIKTVTLFGSG